MDPLGGVTRDALYEANLLGQQPAHDFASWRGVDFPAQRNAHFRSYLLPVMFVTQRHVHQHVAGRSYRPALQHVRVRAQQMLDGRHLAQVAGGERLDDAADLRRDFRQLHAVALFNCSRFDRVASALFAALAVQFGDQSNRPFRCAHSIGSRARFRRLQVLQSSWIFVM